MNKSRWKTMNYMKIKKNSIANFAGVSVSLYVSGCEFYCKNCFNRSSWNPKSGDEFTDEVKKEIFDELKKVYYDNFVILGGEPLLKHNLADVTELAKEFKELYPHKKLVIFTGNTFEQVADYEVFKYTDYLIDGLFVEELYSPKLFFRGSSNQRIIDVQKSLKENETVLVLEYYEKN